MRSDRDDWIKIMYENIYSGYLGQFSKFNSRNVVPYNYGSVMHYNARVGLCVYGVYCGRCLMAGKICRL